MLQETIATFAIMLSKRHHPRPGRLLCCSLLALVTAVFGVDLVFWAKPRSAGILSSRPSNMIESRNENREARDPGGRAAEADEADEVLGRGQSSPVGHFAPPQRRPANRPQD